MWLFRQAAQPDSQDRLQSAAQGRVKGQPWGEGRRQGKLGT